MSYLFFQFSSTFRPVIFVWKTSWLVAVLLISSCASMRPVDAVVTSSQHTLDHEETTLPQIINDPLEPMNRVLWKVNHGLLVGVMQPSGRVYRGVVPKPARQSIKNFTHNIKYPTRLVNNMLQGRWAGAGDESRRFLYNTTVGVGGLFDVASKKNMPRSDANFGQTFTRWGWKPNTYLMMPLLGPSDGPHAFGTLADIASEPWSYARPYTYVSYGTAYNDLNVQTEDAVHFIHTEHDPYVGVKNIWTYVAKDFQPDWSAPGPKDMGTLQTLGFAQIKPVDSKFLQHGKVMSVRMSSTGRKMKFNYWLQKTKAPLVYISPGQGSHRESNVSLALAEMLFQNGYSVVSTTGVFHPEFMENAAATDIPAYPVVDCNELRSEFTDFDRALEKRYPGLFGKRALVGLSMGGFHALYIAATENQAAHGMIQFDRYVAINAPVDLRQGYKSLDACYDAISEWPAAIRQEKVNNTVHKLAALSMNPAATGGVPPFNAIESKFLIGMSFKLTLRDTIYSSQSRHNMGIIKTPFSTWKRNASYNEILQYSFNDYFFRFVLPYYRSRGVSDGDIVREVNLRTHQKQLSADSRIRVLTNKNDIVLHPKDIPWLRSTFGSSRLTVFPDGGHLGNLNSKPVSNKILESLEGL